MSIVTLTTDFGTSSPYVAEMKGVLLSRNPDLTIVDLTHAIEPQSIQQAAFVLAQSIPTFPPKTVHVVVVDPGVGTDRRIIASELGPWRFVGPDNGIIHLAATKFGRGQTVELTQPEFWREKVSSTFHGRDVMAPVAAHLSLGVAVEQLGLDVDDPIELEFPFPDFAGERTRGEVVWVDSFGNLVTNVEEDALTEVDLESAKVELGEIAMVGIHRTFGERAPGEFVAYMGSSGYLEIGKVNGNLARSNNISVGQPVFIQES